MRDTSIFAGVKVLGNYMFKDLGGLWSVYSRKDESYVHIGIITKRKNESNTTLHERANNLNGVIS